MAGSSRSGGSGVTLSWPDFLLPCLVGCSISSVWKANTTTPLTLTHPLVTVVLAIFFLGEDVDLAVLPGIGFVLLGTAFLGSQSGRLSVHSSISTSR